MSVLNTRCKQRILIPHSSDFSSLQIFRTVKRDLRIPVGIIRPDRRVLRDSPLSISSPFVSSDRHAAGKDYATAHPRRSTLIFFPFGRLSHCVGNVDACGHFARNVSSGAPRDIRRQKRGTSPTSIIMCVTCEGEETLSAYIHYPACLVPRNSPIYSLNKGPLRRATEGG